MRTLRSATVVVVVLSLASIAAVPGWAREQRSRAAEHVLLLSVDGLHQSDLDLYVHGHPGSALARLTGAGVQFTRRAHRCRRIRFRA
jgi:hypothetical protein